MATAVRAVSRSTAPTVLNLEMDPIARGVVFPSHVRDVRRLKGFETLRDFDGKVKIGGATITYNRLAKIERGEVVPAPAEITGIAKALKVPVDRLLVDPTSPAFDRTEWAREHIEASLKNRGGDLDAMKLGAAMRVHRLSLKLSTSDLKKYGLPAATASRIENAERPLDRWPRDVRNGIAKFFDVDGFREVTEQVERMFKGGELTTMLTELFSEEAIEARNNRRIRSLLEKLPGSAAKTIGDHLDREYASLPDVLRTTARSRHLDSVLGGGSEGEPAMASDDVDQTDSSDDDAETKGTDDLVVVGSRLGGNRISLETETGAKIRRPTGVGATAVAIRVEVSSVGSRVQPGTVLVAEDGHEIAAGDLVVVRDGLDNTALVMQAVEDDGAIFFEMTSPKSSMSASEFTDEETVCKVMAILMPA